MPSAWADDKDSQNDSNGRLNVETELDDVAVGHTVGWVARFYDFAWWGMPVSMISATCPGTSANAGNAAMRLGDPYVPSALLHRPDDLFGNLVRGGPS